VSVSVHLPDAFWNEVYGQYTESNGKKQDGYLLRAQNVVDALGDNFEFDAFIDAINTYCKQKEPDADKTDIIEALKRKAEAMRATGRIGNALNFELAAKSLRRFVDPFNNEERKEFLNILPPRRNINN
jgi:anaerobic selenocysteine-containing dehydrogenase